jgi:hypothetical protein
MERAEAEILKAKVQPIVAKARTTWSIANMTIGVACSAGSYEGVFVHDVLAGLNELGFQVDIYAASSSTPAAAAGADRCL